MLLRLVQRSLSLVGSIGTNIVSGSTIDSNSLSLISNGKMKVCITILWGRSPPLERQQCKSSSRYWPLLSSPSHNWLDLNQRWEQIRFPILKSQEIRSNRQCSNDRTHILSILSLIDCRKEDDSQVTALSAGASTPQFNPQKIWMEGYMSKESGTKSILSGDSWGRRFFVLKVFFPDFPFLIFQLPPGIRLVLLQIARGGVSLLPESL